MTHFVVNLLFRPGRMLTVKECRLVMPHRPVKPMRGQPALFRCHTTQNFDLLKIRFFLEKSALLRPMEGTRKLLRGLGWQRFRPSGYRYLV